MISKILKVLKYCFTLTALFTGIIFIPYHLAFLDKVIPGVWVGKINLSGKTAERAYSTLDSYFKALSERSVDISFEGSHLLPLEDLGVSLKPKETAVKAFGVGRSGNIFKDTVTKARAYTKTLRLTPEFELNNEVFAAQVGKLFAGDASSFQESSLEVTPQGEVVFKKGQVGRAVDIQNLKSCLLEQVRALALEQATCSARFIEKVPQYSEADFANVKFQAARLSKIKLLLQRTGGSEILSGNQLLALFDVLPSGLFPCQEKVITLVESLSKRIDKAPVNAAFEVTREGELAVFTPAQNGIKVDQDKLTEDIVEALAKVLENLGEVKVYEINVSTQISNPEISSVDNQYGIKELLGVGRSNYHGSIVNRIYNIKLASSKLFGRLIPPGEVVSFNSLLGDVSPETGYKAAYVIIGNQTVLGSGGGVCQTSTTMFRAALNAGLPIIERTAHLYRVHYYEPPLGMDATVMAPYTDLVFQNDTPAYILVQTYVNEATEDVTYEIFGTSDGRVTKISDPEISNQTGYPAARYQDDPTLEKGKVVQVEWPAGGATATVTRQVTRGGSLIQDDTFVSHYVPWPAVYLVGTRE